MTVLFYITV